MYNLQRYHLIAPSIILAVATLLTGCSSETTTPEDMSIQEGLPSDISFTVRSTVQTGADTSVSDPVSKYEKIHSWWFALVNKSGKVVKIISRDDSSTLLTSTSDVEEETFQCTVPSGLYDIYAFANIDAATLKSATGVSFTVGEKISLPAGITDIEKVVWKSTLNNFDASTSYIPMSGLLKNVRIKNNVEEHFSIEVVRMVAKLELSFTNIHTQEEITVTGISLDPVTTSSISLFPVGPSGAGYSHLGQSAYAPLENPRYGKLEALINSNNVIAAGEKNKSINIYFQESISDRANDEAFTIGIKVNHRNPVTDKVGVNNFEQYNITRDILKYINRNDHIFIPVTLSQYDVDIDAVAYPPIGGYPVVASADDPDGSQIFTFGSEGDFAIVAHVTDKDADRHLTADYYSVSVSDINDPSGIFSVSPAVVASTPSLPDEVTGVLGATDGKASFTITVKIYDRPRYLPEAKTVYSYTRKIYIIKA